MYQLYLLSCVLNVLCGITLASDMLMKRLQLSKVLNPEFLEKKSYRMTCAFLTLVVGFLKLLSIVEGSGSFAILGDFLPAIVGMLMGIALFFDSYQEKEKNKQPKNIAYFFSHYRVLLAVTGIIVGVIHFLFPEFLLL